MPTGQRSHSRKGSTSPLRTASPRRIPYLRTRQYKTSLVYIASGFAAVLLLLWLLSGSASKPSTADPATKIVIVTTLGPGMSEEFIDNIKANRRNYARRHGYATFFPNTTSYALMPNVPQRWSTIPAIRHAMSLFPSAGWVFYLTSMALIMNPDEPLSTKVLWPDKLEQLMLGDKPIVSEESVIKTFAHLKGDRVDFILTQEKAGLSTGSMLIRTGDWAKFFLDAWFDPLYRSYNFQKAERHALEHIVQWHSTVLAKLALVPYNILNSHVRGNEPWTVFGDIYREGDFVANFESCVKDEKRNCEEEMRPYFKRLQERNDSEGA